jgi:hypothetical protein
MRLFFLGPRLFGGLIRPGISLGPNDFRSRRSGRPPPIEGAFIYLITGPPGMVKVGVTTDPRGRLATLQTGSAYPLKFAAIMATPGTGYVVEARIHEILQAYRASGEWFRVSPTRTLFAIRQALDELEEPALSVSLEQADDILAIARSAPVGSATPSWVYSWWIPIGGGVLTFALTLYWLLKLGH